MRQTVAEMRMDRADMGRDMKREGSKCAHGVCMGAAKHDAPKGWTGRYGGRRLCTEHYRDVVDELTEAVLEGNDPPEHW